MPERKFHVKPDAQIVPVRGTTIYRMAGPDGDPADATDRLIPYILSSGAVARDNHTINAAGWRLDAFRANPVFCWCHDTSQPPIGRFTTIGIQSGQLRGTVEYADGDTYPFADTIFRLVKGRFLNAVSVGWDPLKWEYSRDKSRPGGIDFLEQELLEVSQVPVPADTTALALARKAGIDTAPLYTWAEKILDLGGSVGIPRAELDQLRRAAKMPTPTRATSNDWKVGAERGLPVNTTSAWDGPAAEARVFADAGFDGDNPDGEKARKAFLFYDAANPSLKSSYKEPFADIIDGKLTAVKSGLDAAASRLDSTDVSDDLKAEGKAVLESYKTDEPARQLALGLAPRTKRDLWDVSWTIDVAAQLSYIQECMECEAAWEGDNSPLPARMKMVLETLSALLKDMLAEELGEMLGGDNVVVYDIEPDDDAAMRAAKTLRTMIRGTLRNALAPLHARLSAASVRNASPRTLALLLRNGMLNESGQHALADLILSRSGKVLNAANEATLRTAHEHMRSAAECVRGVVSQNYVDPDDGENEPDIDELDQIEALDESPAARTARQTRERNERRLRLAAAQSA